MEVFVSYARRDAEAVARLRSDIERARNGVWIDRELEGGEQWWDQILEHIRSCGLFVFALSEDSAHSRACRKELAYAQALHRPTLPVLVGDVDVELAPAPIPSLQIVDYRQRTADSAIELSIAIRDVQPVPLPELLPDPPEPPLVSFAPLQDLLAQDTLTFAEQSDAVRELRERLTDPDARHGAITLLQELRARPDVMESTARDVDQLLASAPDTSTPGRRQHREEEMDLLRSLLTQIKNGHCTPILGWGLTDSLLGPRRMMAREWAETFEFPLAVHFQDDLPQVANFVAVMTDVATLRESLGEFYREQLRSRYPELRSNDASVLLSDLVRQAWTQQAAHESDPYYVLADLPCPIFVNAHPTTLLTDALKEPARSRSSSSVVGGRRCTTGPSRSSTRSPTTCRTRNGRWCSRCSAASKSSTRSSSPKTTTSTFSARSTENVGLVPPPSGTALADSALLLLGIRLERVGRAHPAAQPRSSRRGPTAEVHPRRRPDRPGRHGRVARAGAPLPGALLRQVPAGRRSTSSGAASTSSRPDWRRSGRAAE